jgi:hypothetical protein
MKRRTFVYKIVGVATQKEHEGQPPLKEGEIRIQVVEAKPAQGGGKAVELPHAPKFWVIIPADDTESQGYAERAVEGELGIDLWDDVQQVDPYKPPQCVSVTLC